MNELLAAWYYEGSPTVLDVLRGLLVFLVTFLGPIGTFLLVVYLLFSVPLRRRERARLFLDLLETGLGGGQSAEHTIVGAASSQDPAPGVRFQMVAAHLESGCRLSEAVDRVPRFLPPQVASMLRLGEELGDLRKVLPVCREHLQDGLARAGNALNAMPLILYVMLALPVGVMLFLKVYILPRFKDIAVDMGVTSFPGITRMVFSMDTMIILAALGSFLFMMALLLSYWGGPRVQSWVRCLAGPSFDWLLYRVPWRRERLHRDFAGLLALLLDADVPEAQAVQMAAEATANGVVIKRAAQVAGELKQGVALPDALKRMDERGEFAWRLSNAAQSRGLTRFAAALAGWREALDARAFQLEQTATQLFSTGFVLFNGIIVGLILVGIFAVLVQLIEHMLI